MICEFFDNAIISPLCCVKRQLLAQERFLNYQEDPTPDSTKHYFVRPRLIPESFDHCVSCKTGLKLIKNIDNLNALDDDVLNLIEKHMAILKERQYVFKESFDYKSYAMIRDPDLEYAGQTPKMDMDHIYKKIKKWRKKHEDKILQTGKGKTDRCSDK